MRLNSGSKCVTLSSGSWDRGLSEGKKGNERESEKTSLCKSFKNRLSPVIKTFSTLLLLPRAPLLWGFQVSPPHRDSQHWGDPSRIILIPGSFIECRLPGPSPAKLIQKFWMCPER